MIEQFHGRWFFLSNFYPIEITHQGIKYPTVEHYYQAQKSNNEQFINGKFYTNNDFKEMISKIKNPGQVKQLSKQIKIRSDWSSVKYGIMKYGVEQKFKDENLKELLLTTENYDIIEYNLWHDNYWGFCKCDNCKSKEKNNKLGKIITEIRNELNGKKRRGLNEFI